MARLGKAISAIVVASGLLALSAPEARVRAQNKASDQKPPRAPAPNPFLAGEKYAIARVDPAGTGAFPYAVPRGTFRVDLRRTPRIVQGPLNRMTYVATSPDFMWAQSSQGVVYVDVSKGGLREVARLAAPGVKVISPELHKRVLGQRFTDLAQVISAVTDDYALDETRLESGALSLVDRDNQFFFGTPITRTISIFALKDATDPSVGLRLIRTADFSPSLRPQETLQGLAMTYDGQLVVLCTNSLWLIDRSLRGKPTAIRFGPDEFVRSGLALDDRNGIYFVSNKLMHKVVWTGSRLSENEADGAWTAAYDGGPRPPPSPTLMGFGDDPDKLVVISAGSQPNRLVAFWRDAIPPGFQQRAGTKSKRIADQIAISVQNGLSAVVAGYGAFVTSDVARKPEDDKLIDLLALGAVNEPAHGAERLTWDPTTDSWRSAWKRDDVVSTGAIPTVSSASNIVFVGGYGKRDGWEVTGLDWNSGRSVHRTIFGHGSQGNGACALIQFLPNGDLLFNGIGGQARVRLAKSR